MIGSNQVSNVASSVVTPVALSGFKTPLLNEFEGASAAYSLRRLKSWEDGSKVVRVRRATDNAEQDFSSVDVANGTMANWVNAYTDLPLDVDSGAAAAYSLRNLKASGTDVTTSGDTAGDTTGKYIVQVRRSSDDAVQSFTAAEVADGTLESWVGASLDIVTPTLNNGGFETAGTNGFDYWTENVSGSSTITRDTSEFYSGTASCRFDIDSSGSFASIRTPVSGGIFNVGTTLTYSIRAKGTSGSKLLIGTAGNDSRNDTLNLTTEWQEYTGTVNPDDADTNVQIKRLDSANATIWIDEVTFTINGKDGHVKTWYDQSGNTNHATQTDPANQPKIVENGSVLEDSAGNPEIDFDGTSHRFDIDFGSNLPQPNSIFMVHQSDSVLEADNKFFDEKDTTGQRTLLDVTTMGAERRYRILASTSLSSTNLQVTTDKNLVSAIYNGSNSSLSLNGDAFNFTNTVGGDSIARLSSIGFSEGTGGYYDGTMQEFIIYNSDQSDNRTAIEANIGDYYSIDLPAGVDSGNNEVDGFVTKWYDQSGNGNDAVQTTAANQPKIVDAGTLVAGGIDFDGVDDGFSIDFGADLTQANSLFLVHQSDTLTDASNEFFDSAGGAAPRTLFDQSGTNYRLFSGTSADTGVALTNDQSLVSAIYNGASSLFAKNGTATGALNAGTAAIKQNSTLGFSSTRFYDGTMQEFIIYNSDQSANRTGIEANIADEYGITLS